MKIIGISGKKRSGKDTLCQALIDTIGDRQTYRIGFADGLKDELCTAMGVTPAYIEQNKAALRLLLQAWGTDYRRNLCDKDYWIKKAFTRILKLPAHIQYVVIPDVRFQSEAEALRGIGAVLVRINSMRSPQDNHSSEVDLDRYPHFHITVDNNGTLDDLKRQATNIITKIK